MSIFFRDSQAREDAQFRYVAGLHEQINEAERKSQVAIAWARECCAAISKFVPDHRFHEDLDKRIFGRLNAGHPDFEQVLGDFYKPISKKRKTA